MSSETLYLILVSYCTFLLHCKWRLCLSPFSKTYAYVYLYFYSSAIFCCITAYLLYKISLLHRQSFLVVTIYKMTFLCAVLQVLTLTGFWFIFCSYWHFLVCQMYVVPVISATYWCICAVCLCSINVWRYCWDSVTAWLFLLIYVLFSRCSIVRCIKHRSCFWNVLCCLCCCVVLVIIKTVKYCRCWLCVLYVEEIFHFFSADIRGIFTVENG